MLDHNNVSRYHAEVEVNGKSITVIDRQSRFGTRLNGDWLAPEAKTEMREGDCLELGVDDTATRLVHSPTEGTGLALTRRRLKELYGDAASLELHRGPAGCTRAEVRLPWRWIPEEDLAGDR